MAQPINQETETNRRPYAGTPGKPKAWIFDIDGTLALNRSGRSFYDMTRVGEDDPNPAVVQLARALHAQNLTILVVSGRWGDGRLSTEQWLKCHVGDWATKHLHMRETDDHRPDDIVKHEIFDNAIRDHFDVVGVVDDRNSVVAFWRSLGLTCLQAAPGDF